MPIDPSVITQGLTRVQPVSPLEAQTQALHLRAMQQQIDNANALEQERREGLAKQKRSEAEQQTLSDAMDQAWVAGPDGSKTINRSILQQTVPGHLWPTVAASFDKQDEDTAKALKLKSEAQNAADDTIGSAMAGVRASGYAVGSFAAHVDHLAQNGLIPRQQQALWMAKVQADPTAVKAITDEYLATSEKRASLLQTERGHDLTASGQAETGRHNVVTEEAAAANVAREVAAQAETARHNRAQEGIEGQKLAQSQADVTNLTPEGLDAAAMMFAKTGQLPALGMGDKTTRKAIINRAAVMVPGLDVASAKADFESNRKSLDNIAGTLDTLESFSKAAGKNLDQFVGLAQKVPDTGVPWANTPIRLLNDKMVGAEWAPAVNAARAVATREVARITGDPKLKGVLSDAARHEVDALVPNDITFNQLKRVIPVLKTDMENVHSSLSEQKSAIQQRIKLATAPAAEPPPPPSTTTTPSAGPSYQDYLKSRSGGR